MPDNTGICSSQSTIDSTCAVADQAAKTTFQGTSTSASATTTCTCAPTTTRRGRSLQTATNDFVIEYVLVTEDWSGQSASASPLELIDPTSATFAPVLTELGATSTEVTVGATATTSVAAPPPPPSPPCRLYCNVYTDGASSSTAQVCVTGAGACKPKPFSGCDPDDSFCAIDGCLSRFDKSGAWANTKCAKKTAKNPSKKCSKKKIKKKCKRTCCQLGY